MHQGNDQSKQRIESFPVKVEFLSELKRHTAPVNVVRFSPKGDYLASAGDGMIFFLYIETRFFSSFFLTSLTRFFFLIFDRFMYYHMEIIANNGNI